MIGISMYRNVPLLVAVFFIKRFHSFIISNYESNLKHFGVYFEKNFCYNNGNETQKGEKNEIRYQTTYPRRKTAPFNGQRHVAFGNGKRKASARVFSGRSERA
jgi:hypothetical protein